MKRKLIKVAILSLLALSSTLFVISQVMGYRSVYQPRPSYDKTGFVDKDDFVGNDIVLENAQFKWTLNTTNTTFELFDKTTVQTWYSNPQHDTLLIPADARELFVLYYERKIEASKRVSVNEESIQYNRFSFRVTNDSVEVLYKVGGKHNISMTDLPRQVGKEKFDEKILIPLEEKAETNSTIRRQLSFLKAQFNYVEAEKRFYLKTLTSQDSIDIVYNLIFNESLYTQEDYEEDALTYGFETSKALPYFEFSVKYALTNTGFKTTLINDSIVESEDFPLAFIDVLPFFGAGNMGDTGFTVIPDGSGIYVDHNNQKYSSTVYEKRIYGSDLSIGNAHAVKPDQGEKIGFPMYGYQLNGYAYFNTIEAGDAMSTLRAGFLTESASGSYVHKIPYVHYRYALRERDAFIFQSSAQSQRVTSYTTDYNKQDFVAYYQFLPNSNATYFDIAKMYQQYLVHRFDWQPILSQYGTAITLLGGFKEKSYVLGIPTTRVKALTSVDGVMKIKAALMDKGIDDLSLTYFGFSNDGIKPTVYKELTYNDKVATEKQLKKLINSLNSQDIPMYLEFMASEAYTKQDLNLDKEVSQNIFHNPVYRYPYDEATFLADRTQTIRYILNIPTQQKVLHQIVKSTDRLNANIGLADFGSQIASNLQKGSIMFRNEVVAMQIEMLEQLKDQQLQLRNPNLYALNYADSILDLSVTGTLHKIVDYDIPFIQMVLNGYFNYAGPSINTYNQKTVNWHLLKTIETGANVQWTFTERNTIDLVKTEYNHLYATYYAYWLSDVERIHDVIADLGIMNKKIVKHEVLNPQGSWIEVTYEGNLVIRINYETESFVVVS